MIPSRYCVRPLLAVLFVLLSISALAEAPLPPADPDKPLYQWTGWPPPGNMWLLGKCRKVAVDVKSAEELQDLAVKKAKQEMQLTEMQRGSWLMMIGMIVAAAGVACHFLTAYPILQRLSEYVLVFGGCLTAAGLVLKKIAQFQNWLFFGLVAIAVAAVLYKCRNWSVSHLVNKTRGATATPPPPPASTNKETP